ncbi:MAG TPA: thiamine phosphate synthase [Gemmatimonadaceae bacterium]|nr:thiamine phosphate synthase [Gemmatimonadaceae bacterium]
MSEDTPMYNFPVVHAVTDNAALARADFLERAASIMRALRSRGAVHLRSSTASGRRFHDLAVRLAELQNETGCWLIVNDRADVGAAVGAKGVQLASHSLTISDALTAAPGMRVGSSIHSVEEAQRAEDAGASWCVAGTVFETPSHPDATLGRIGFIEKVASSVRIPVIAIGGIEPSDVPALRRAGAHGIATIRGAGWDRGEPFLDDDPMRHTTLFAIPTAVSVEPVTRYISAYDSSTGSGQNDHPDGERRSEGAGA